MVGYVENAVVGSQIRFRFDAGWHNDFPDRAEFFYAKCGCFRGTPASPGPDPDAPGPGGAATDVNFLDFDMYAEYAPHGRFSLFAEVPVRRIEPQAFAANAGTFENAGGLSDIRAGFKVGLTATDSTAVTFQFRSYLPTGDAAKGLGTDHAAVESSALVYHQITYRTAIELQVGEWHPIGASSAAGVPGAAADEGFAGDILFFGFGPSYKLYERNDFLLAPVAELFAWRVLSGFQTGPASPSDASGTNIVNLKVGARASFGIHDSIYVGYGRALTDSKWYKDIFRVEYRYSF
jgi:hypothetical protein